MVPNEKLGLSGQLKMVLTGPDGKVKEERTEKNLIVNAGLGYIASRMTGVAAGVMSHMALGSSTTAAAAAQTDLITILGSRVAITSATVGGASNEQIAYVCTFGPGSGTGAVTEAGIFNAATVGTMLCRTVFAVVNKAAGDSLQITWTVTLAAA